MDGGGVGVSDGGTGVSVGSQVAVADGWGDGATEKVVGLAISNSDGVTVKVGVKTSGSAVGSALAGWQAARISKHKIKGREWAGLTTRQCVLLNFILPLDDILTSLENFILVMLLCQ